MASSLYSGCISDPDKCRLLSVDAKRELVLQLSKCPHIALGLLHNWTSHDVKQILFSVFCREKKYDGVSKKIMLKYLFQAVNGEPSGHGKRVSKSDPEQNSSTLQFPHKKQRKNDATLLPVIASTPVTTGVTAPTNSACRNLACRASLNPADKFCRRCSCCICFKYDDNKDPSLWLSCNSDQPLQGESCGLSCHLECAFGDERSGIVQSGSSKKLDGAYYCVHCGRQNDLLGCWKKQLLIAKDARRSDVLCHRIFLSHKLLISSKKYLVLHEFVDTALKKLEGELGPISGLEDKGQGIVGRLVVGAEVQKLCNCAMETLESMLSGALTTESQSQSSCVVPSKFIKLEDISHESVTVVFDLNACPMLSQGLTGFNLWHREASKEHYSSIPTGIVPVPSTMLVVRGLAPRTSYVIKVVAFTNSKEIGSWEVRTNTINCPKEMDAKDSVPIYARKDLINNTSTKTNSSGLSNPSSEDVESNNDNTTSANLSRSPESDVEYWTSLEKVSHRCNETDGDSRDLKTGVAGVTKVDVLEEAPRGSASALDDNEEEPGSAAEAALPKRPSELMGYSREALKQNLATICSEIASHEHTGNESVSPPEYRGTPPHVTQEGTENCRGFSARCIEAKSDDHILQDDGWKAETDPRSLSCKGTPGKCENSGHSDVPSEPHTSAQAPALRKSSNLPQRNKPDNAAGSPVPVTGSGSKPNKDGRVPQPCPLKPGPEPGKPKDAECTDVDAYVYCVKVIRWLECEGYVEASFRVKFLTWLSLRATRQEKRVVSVFVDTFIDDPASLAGQLIDTFSEMIYGKRPPMAP
ncbi:hypothetical protein ZWY2020_001597 [Hordeum vulgare]|nr:hypothetical protein ZWY2020_001597 [Hordeum vulgare]